MRPKQLFDFLINKKLSQRKKERKKENNILWNKVPSQIIILLT